jgi:glycosyltransferase involved in cell wall biosynthesis
VNLEAPRPDRAAHNGPDSESEIARLSAQLHPAVRVRFLPYSWRNGQLSILGAVRGMLKATALAMFNKYALFILWSALPIVVFGPVLRLLNRPTAYMVTGLGGAFSERNKGRLIFRVLCVVYRLVLSGPRSVVIVHNWEDRNILAKLADVDPNRIIVTGGCGVDPDEYPYRGVREPSAVPTILVPGRLLKEKGIIDAAAASGILSARGVRHRMVFTHVRVTGRAEALTEQEFETASSQPDVHFIGYQQSIHELYAETDVVCVPSWYREGLQTALVEAAATGCPIVVCDNVGVRDFIRPEMDGIIAPSRDPAALADCLERMLGNPAMADGMQRSAYRRFLDGFTKRHMLNLTFDAFAIIGYDPRTSGDQSGNQLSLRGAQTAQ